MLINHDNAPSPHEAIVIAGRVVRSLLAVPVCDETRLANAYSSQADGLVVDLTAQGATMPRIDLADDLARPDRPLLFFATKNHADSEVMAAEVAALMTFSPAGVILCGITVGADIQRLDVMLSVAEARLGRAAGTTAILALCGDNPAGVLAAQQGHAETSARLAALGFHAGRLARALRLPAPNPGTALPNAITVARGLLQLAATSARLGCFNWLDPHLSGDRLAETCKTARDEGFAALVGSSTDQIEAINAAFRNSGC
ncbi:hypothetical protein HFC70_15660 [Agrobacterium sp. a22-2]|uniref:hypothetical protein n=1 Tax=Agrobacterium sp. a22-2 TaxID=2283840 RepID=UPI001445E1EF|nr:hypothetical protein [Agrobacterium sp. a22-2]NKN37788.1 hypothetical protein [Agrobacterium sp. a22-2]